MAVADSLLTPVRGSRFRDTRTGCLVLRVAREPLLHFLLLGTLIFVLGDLHGTDDQQYRIVIDRTRVEKLARTYAQQFGGPPSPQMLRTLTDNYINEEILYREGLAMRLDRDDEVIRRRVVQKVQFLEQDVNPPAAPSNAALRDFYDNHRARYVTPLRISFTHIYFSPDKGGDAQARERALAVLASLGSKTPRAPERGDPYPDLNDYASIAPDDAARLFGRTPISQALFKAPPQHWSGPFRSGYGWHLVYVSARQPERQMPFDQVREEVRADYQAAAQDDANTRNFAALKAHYHVVREGVAP